MLLPGSFQDLGTYRQVKTVRQKNVRQSLRTEPRTKKATKDTKGVGDTEWTDRQQSRQPKTNKQTNRKGAQSRGCPGGDTAVQGSPENDPLPHHDRAENSTYPGLGRQSPSVS